MVDPRAQIQIESIDDDATLTLVFTWTATSDAPSIDEGLSPRQKYEVACEHWRGKKQPLLDQLKMIEGVDVNDIQGLPAMAVTLNAVQWRNLFVHASDIIWREGLLLSPNIDVELT